MSKVGKIAKGCGLFLLYVTWCALQTFVGALLALVLLSVSRAQLYRGMIVIYHPLDLTFSLGTFAFVSNGAEDARDARGRMYGQYLQSLIYGPLFLFIVVLPQLIVRIPCIKKRREERGIGPTDLFVRRQARRLRLRAGE